MGGVEMTRREFEEHVADALDLIPPELTQAMSNVVVLVEDEPPPGSPNLLGLYQGVSLTRRTTDYSGGLPDHIFIYRGPLLRYCHDVDDLVEQIAVTVVHEVGHHFGISDERLHELGWG
ncbi:metallopeptidase family protein [Actinosynnema sp. NPDC059335]|uniref:metallopeptidase family protein n=1 Tax=Actinosynnema sp. NPDC059335 TaxID=3346804 RepID=UPI00366BB076